MLCRSLSACFVILGGAVLCMLFHVLLQCLHVCSKIKFHRRCVFALQHVSILLGMLRCCIAEVVSASRRTLRRVVFAGPPAGHHWPACCTLPEFFWALAFTTLVPKHVSQNSGCILFAYVVRDRTCRCMRATPLCRLVKPRPRVLMVCGDACAYHADDENKHDRDTSMCF